jgi:hypothetical protein
MEKVFKEKKENWNYTPKNLEENAFELLEEVLDKGIIYEFQTTTPGVSKIGSSTM